MFQVSRVGNKASKFPNPRNVILRDGRLYYLGEEDKVVRPAKVIPIRLPFALNCLKRLHISWIAVGKFFDFSFALCLIRSSPNLEDIEIEMSVFSDELCNEPVPRDAIDKIPASFSDMTFNQLKKVKIKHVSGADAEIQLIKVLLAKSPALVKMVIEPRSMEDKKSLKVLEEITNFQWASSKAQLDLHVSSIRS
ncbi:hypothetical protein CQW23_25307 [Capsicum baccatum]|uniref:FBD domain-containing protein n=1 Tax=Capsicum baccatum TaxID=33114 RepID=A0A2G2VKL6_CAPBA|nr:hypothetical protein CQW23_25307 [Capsicum baccatum]